MRRFCDGDRRAFRELLERHESSVYAFFLRSFGDPERAADCAQETFLRVVRSRDSFRVDASFRTWMWRIVRNLRTDTLRRMSHRRHESLDAPLGDEGGERAVDRVVDAADVGAERDTDGARFKAALAAAVTTLEPDQREVFLLRQMQGLPFREIAVIQDVNVNTVKSRMRYALTRLREALRPFAPNGGEP